MRNPIITRIFVTLCVILATWIAVGCGDIQEKADPPANAVELAPTTTVETTTTTTIDWEGLAKWRAEIDAQEAAAKKQQQASKPKASSSSAPRRSSSTGGLTPAQNPCAIPSYICARESNNTLNAKNPRSTASGKYQFLDSTWNGYGGYSHASDAPEDVQDAKARELWNGGRGCSHWSAC